MRSLQIARLCTGLMVLALAVPAFAQTATPTTPTFTTPAPSPGAKVTQTVGTTEMSVSYSRPGVKGRTIWGTALVPYDGPWRMGANSPTQFTSADDVMVQDQKLAAGTYAMIALASPDSWTIAFSAQKDLQGSSNYDAKHDVLRVNVKPVPAEFVERMQFTFDDPTNDAVTLNLRWEKLSVPLKLTVDTNGKTLAAARAAVAAAKPDDWRTPYRAATWAHDNGVAAAEAAQWAQTASKSKENFQTAGLLARMAQKTGDMKNAVALMKKSIEHGKADTNVTKDQVAGNEKMLTEWTAKK
jgi:hypothetical protein